MMSDDYLGHIKGKVFLTNLKQPTVRTWIWWTGEKAGCVLPWHD